MGGIVFMLVMVTIVLWLGIVTFNILDLIISYEEVQENVNELKQFVELSRRFEDDGR